MTRGSDLAARFDRHASSVSAPLTYAQLRSQRRSIRPLVVEIGRQIRMLVVLSGLLRGMMRGHRRVVAKPWSAVLGMFGSRTSRARSRSAPAPSTIAHYHKRISGQLMDRIDIHLVVPRIEYEKLADRRLDESSAKVRNQVSEARARQTARFNQNGTTLNSDPSASTR